MKTGDSVQILKETPFLSLNGSPPGPRHYMCLRIMSHKSLAQPVADPPAEMRGLGKRGCVSLGKAKLTCSVCIAD